MVKKIRTEVSTSRTVPIFLSSGSGVEPTEEAMVMGLNVRLYSARPDYTAESAVPALISLWAEVGSSLFAIL